MKKTTTNYASGDSGPGGYYEVLASKLLDIVL